MQRIPGSQFDRFRRAAMLVACNSDGTSTLSGGGHTYTPVESPAASAAASGGTGGGGAATVVTTPGSGGVTPGTGGTTGNNGADPTAATNVNIDQRQVNYGEAMRTASLKLLGDLPTLAQISQMAVTLDPARRRRRSTESMVDQFLADPRFAAKMIQYWRDTLKTGPAGKRPRRNAELRHRGDLRRGASSSNDHAVHQTSSLPPPAPARPSRTARRSRRPSARGTMRRRRASSRTPA